jgi:hypothetical protein
MPPQLACTTSGTLTPDPGGVLNTIVCAVAEKKRKGAGEAGMGTPPIWILPKREKSAEKKEMSQQDSDPFGPVPVMVTNVPSSTAANKPKHESDITQHKQCKQT